MTNQKRGGKRENAGRPKKLDKVKQKAINIDIAYYQLMAEKAKKTNKSIKNAIHDVINFWLANQPK